MGVRTKALVAALVIAQLSIVTIGNSPTTLAAGEGTISGSVLTDGASTLEPPFDGGGAQPVPATVNVVDSASGDTVATTTTDAAGVYTVAGLDLGSYQVSATVEGNATPWWHGGTFGPRATAAPATIVLDSTVPARANVDLSLPTGGFGGWIYGPDGPDFGFFGATATFAETTSGYTESVAVGPDGGFGLGYIPVGSYDLSVTWPGGTYTFPDSYETGPVGLSMAVTVPGILSGTVLTDGVSVLKAPYSGGGQQPVPYATVTAVDATTGSLVMSRQADENGFYSFGYGVPGSYQLYAQAPGNTGKLWFDGAGFGERVDLTPTTVTIPDTNTRVADVNFAFPTGGFGGWVFPTIGGVPTVTNATVRFDLLGGGYSETATVDASGGFGLGYIPTGEYTATIRYEAEPGTGYYRNFAVPGTYLTGDTGLSVAFDLPITPPAPATVRGTVLRADSSPAGGVLVRLLRADGTVQTSVNTQPDGEYLMTVAPGEYRLAVAVANESAVVPISLGEGTDTIQNLPMTAATGLRQVLGSFVDGDGDGFDNGNAYFSCDGGVNASVFLSPTGTFSTTLPDAPCTFYGNVARSTVLDPNADPMTNYWNRYWENYSFPTTQLPAGEPYEFTIDTVPVTINVTDGNGTQLGVDYLSANAYNFAPPMPGTPPQATFAANSFNHRYGDPTITPQQPFIGPFTIDALALPNINLTIKLPDGRQLTQTINTTNGLPQTVDVVVPTLQVRQVLGSFVDGDGDGFDNGNAYFSCDGGVNASVFLSPTGTFSTTLPDAPCTFYGNVARSTVLDPNADPMTNYWNRYWENYSFPTTQLPAGEPYEFTIDTVPVTINVTDGNGTQLGVDYLSANAYNFAPPMPGTPPQATFAANSFNHRYGDPTITPQQPFIGPFTIDALALPNINLTIKLPDGRQLTQTINTTNGLPQTVDVVVPTLQVRQVLGSFVDGDGDGFDNGNAYFSCDGGVNASVFLSPTGTFSTTLPDAPCTFYGNVARSTVLDPNADPMTNYWNRYWENYSFPTTQLPAGEPYEFTIDTVPVTINVTDGNGTQLGVDYLSANAYNFAPPMPGTPPQATFAANSFNHRYGDPTITPQQPFIGPFTIDALALPNINLTIKLPDGRQLTQTINTTNGPATVDLIVAGTTPFWVVAESGAQTDTDGVDDYVESLAPNDGDGDNNGVKDSLEPNVASFPSATPDQTYVTLKTSSPGAVIQNVRTIEAVANPDNAPVGWTAPPANFVLPEGLADFQVSGLTPGATEQITIFSSNTSKITGYAKFQNGTWTTLPTENVEILLDRVIITLVDGGVGDDDGLANGVIVDPGGIVEVTDSEPPVITCPAAPTIGFRSIGATLTASVTDDGVGVSSPSVTVDLDTGTPGAQTVAVTAADTVGNEATVDCGFRVAYNVQEFTPVQFGSIARSVRNSTTVPFTFRVTDALGAAVTGDVVASPVSTAVSCPAGFVFPMVSAAFLPEATFQIGNGSWFAGWRPPRSMRNTCQQVTIALDDGSSLQYVIKVT